MMSLSDADPRAYTTAMGYHTVVAHDISQRNHSIDLLRVVAAFGIVWAHMLMSESYSALLGYTALTVFLIMVPYLSVTRQERREDRFLAAGEHRPHIRIQRIIGPWLFWCLVYKLPFAYQQRDISAIAQLDDPYSLLVGPSIHLWFLPFILIASAIFFPITRAIKSPSALIAATLAAVVVSSAVLYVHDTEAIPQPFAQWAFAMPPFLFSLLAAHARKFGLGYVPVAIYLGVCTLFLVFGHAYWPFFCMLAVVVFALAYTSNYKNERFYSLGKLSFGIYLTHPIFMLVWFKFVGPTSHLFIGAVVVFLLSAITTTVLLRIPRLSSFV